MSRGFRDIPPVGQGTWQLESDDRSAAVKALERGLELGLTHIDTAEMYGSGQAESIVAEAIAGKRDQVFLVSKVLPSNASKKKTVTSCEASLSRLRTDHLDAYLLHWPGSHPLEDTIAAFEQLKTDGKIRAWGVSNFDVAELEEAERIAGPGRIACNQVLHHLRERQIERDVLPWCLAHGVQLVGYSPFGSGNFPRSGALAEIAEETETNARAVALSFLVSRGTLTIPKAARITHVELNAAALHVLLTPEQIARIEAAFPGPSTSRPLPTL